MLAGRKEDAVDWWEWMRGLKTDQRNNTSQAPQHGQTEQMGKWTIVRLTMSVWAVRTLLYSSVFTASRLCRMVVVSASGKALVNQDSPAQSNLNYSSHERPLEEKVETTNPSSSKSLSEWKDFWQKKDVWVTSFLDVMKKTLQQSLLFRCISLYNM